MFYSPYFALLVSSTQIGKVFSDFLIFWLFRVYNVYMIELDQIYNEDCLVGMKRIPDKSIDCIICDLPYGNGITTFKWDCLIPFEELWEQYKRVIKDDGVIVLFSQQPFTSQLIMSNMEMWRYNWVWDKKQSTGFLNCAYKPLNRTEDICIFSKATVGSLSHTPIIYYPQGVTEVNLTKKNNPNNSWRKNKGYPDSGNKLNSDSEFVQKYTNYPTNILSFGKESGLHPTQKPVPLIEYLIKTYSKEGETILDNCMGSGTTAVAALNTNRHFIGFEISEEYFKIASERVAAVKSQEKLF